MALLGYGRQATKDIDTNPNITLQLLFKLVHNFSEPLFSHQTLSFTRLTSHIGHSVNTPEPCRLQPKHKKSSYRAENNMITVKSEA
jgi:hypothetical protein